MPLDAAVDHLANKAQPALRAHAAAWHLNSSSTNRESLQTTDIVRRLLNNDATHMEVAFNALDELAKEDRARHLTQRSAYAREPRGPSALLGSVDRFAHVVQALRVSQDRNYQRFEPKLQIKLDPETLVTDIKASIVAHRDASEFIAASDACGWANRLPLFFQSSNLGTFTGGQFDPLEPPQVPGSAPYEDKFLLEHVNISLNPFFPLAAENVLNARHDQREPCPTGDALCGLDVSLNVCLSTRVGVSSVRGGIDVDSGVFTATPLEPVNGTKLTRLCGTKRARFTKRYLCGWEVGRLMNLIAPVLLGPWLALLVFESAYVPTE